MFTRGAIGYSLKESSCMSKATYLNLYYLDEAITGAIVILADRKTLTRVFMASSAVLHAYLVLAQGLNLFPAEVLSPKIGDLIVNTDCSLLLIVGLLLFDGKNRKPL